MKSRRIGSVTLGLTLIVFGMLFFLSIFIKNLDYMYVVKFWPVIFIFLGIEMLVAAFSKRTEGAKVDIPSCIMTFLLIGFSMALAAVQFALDAFPQYLERYM